MGNYDDIDYSDYLNRKEDSPYLPKEDVHTLFSNQYGLEWG